MEIPFIFQNLPQRRDLNILDLGCTEISLPIHLASLGYNIIGLDFRNYPYFHPNLKFTRGDALHLPFKSEIFDLVICVSTLEHIGLGYYKDPLEDEDSDFKAMKEIYRILKSDGMIFITVPFGKAYRTTPQQRIYSSERLKALLSTFSIRTKQFFANFSNGKNNYWLEIGEDEALNKDSPEDITNCICLIKAIKK